MQDFPAAFANGPAYPASGDGIFRSCWPPFVLRTFLRYLFRHTLLPFGSSRRVVGPSSTMAILVQSGRRLKFYLRTIGDPVRSRTGICSIEDRYPFKAF